LSWYINLLFLICMHHRRKQIPNELIQIFKEFLKIAFQTKVLHIIKLKSNTAYSLSYHWTNVRGNIHQHLFKQKNKNSRADKYHHINSIV